MTREEIIEQLAATSGPFSPDRIGELPNDPAIIEVVRELLRLPWPDDPGPDDPREFAPIIAGLLRDAASARALVALLLEAEDQEWDTVIESCVAAAGAIGAAMLDPLVEAIELLEVTTDLEAAAAANVDSDESRSFYRYWGSVNALAAAGAGDRSTHETISRMARERLRRFVPRLRQSGPLEVWLELARAVGLEELRSAAEEALGRYPAGSSHPVVGGVEVYWERWGNDDVGGPRERLLRAYRNLIRFREEWSVAAEGASRISPGTWLHLLRTADPALAPERVRGLEPTPELLEALRTEVAPPYPDEGAQVVLFAPMAAAILLALHGDASDAERLLDATEVAAEVAWDSFLETIPACLAALGPDAISHIIARIERIEESFDDSGLIASDAIYLTLLEALDQIAMLHPETHDALAAAAIERIADASHDQPDRRSGTTLEEQLKQMAQTPTRAEAWIMAAFDIDHPGVEAAIRAFYARHDPDYSSPFAASLESYESREKRKMTRQELEKQLMEEYAYARLDTGPRPSPLASLDDDELDRFFANPAPVPPTRTTGTILRETPKVGRNDPCPCGSGRKYKKCHGK